MEYKVSSDLLKLIGQVEKRLIINFYFALVITAFFSVKLFKVGSFDLSFYVCELLLVVALGFIQYAQIIPKGKIINKTANEVVILKEHIVVKTPSFKVLFWINKPALYLEFKMSSAKLRKVPYTLKPIYDLSDFVWELSYQENKVYIISDYFGPEMLERLLASEGLQVFS